MEDELYEVYKRYFATLSEVGRVKESEVRKILFYTFIDFLANRTSILIPEDDYMVFEKALYALYGRSCMMPYPDYCETPGYKHLGSKQELLAIEDLFESMGINLYDS